jgi:uncharacterized ferredoxin-like protein
MVRIRINDWPQYSPDDLKRRKNVLLAAKLMVNAAMTAPNAGGIPQIESEIVYGYREQEKVARKMEELAYQVKDNVILERQFKYEAVMVRESDAIIFLGNYRANETPMDAYCGACGGKDDCSFVYERRNSSYGLIDSTKRNTELLVDGPLCVVRVQDLGYGVGSALYLANRLLVDARPFFTVGVAGQKLGYCSNSSIVVGILVSALAKNPYVDIHTDYHLINQSKLVDAVRKIYTIARQSGGDYRISDPGAEREKEKRRSKKEGK